MNTLDWGWYILNNDDKKSLHLITFIPESLLLTKVIPTLLLRMHIVSDNNLVGLCSILLKHHNWNDEQGQLLLNDLYI